MQEQKTLVVVQFHFLHRDLKKPQPDLPFHGMQKPHPLRDAIPNAAGLAAEGPAPPQLGVSPEDLDPGYSQLDRVSLPDLGDVRAILLGSRVAAAEQVPHPARLRSAGIGMVSRESGRIAEDCSETNCTTTKTFKETSRSWLASC
jgi:hypothetical protein